MTCGFTLWERAFLFSTTSEHCCFIQLAASIQAVPLSRPVHSLLPEESNLVCVFFVCFVHFELIIIWLRLLALLSMFSFRLSRADDFCRWSWLCGRCGKDASGGRPKRTALDLTRLWSPGLTALHNTTTTSSVWTSRVRCAVRRYVTVHARGGKKSYNCELTWLKFGGFFEASDANKQPPKNTSMWKPHPQFYSFCLKDPRAAEGNITPPLHYSPARVSKIYNAWGMSEKRSAFIRTIFPTVALWISLIFFL